MIDLLYTISKLCCLVDNLTAKQKHISLQRDWHTAKRKTSSLTNNKRAKGFFIHLGELLDSMKIGWWDLWERLQTDAIKDLASHFLFRWFFDDRSIPFASVLVAWQLPLPS